MISRDVTTATRDVEKDVDFLLWNVRYKTFFMSQ